MRYAFLVVLLLVCTVPLLRILLLPRAPSPTLSPTSAPPPHTRTVPVTHDPRRRTRHQTPSAAHRRPTPTVPGTSSVPLSRALWVDHAAPKPKHGSVRSRSRSRSHERPPESALGATTGSPLRSITLVVYAGLHDASVLLAHSCSVLIVGVLAAFTNASVEAPAEMEPFWAPLWHFLKGYVPPPIPPDNVTFEALVLEPRNPLSPSIVPRKALHTVQHHHAHAVYAFLDSPFRSALVLTIDGGGGPLAFGIWKGTRKPFGVTRLAAPCPYLGIAWIRFVSHKSLTLLRDLQCTQKHCNWGPVSAAFMDLGTLGTVRLQWLQSMMRVAQLCPYHGPKSKAAVRELYSAAVLTTAQDQMDFAATAQRVLEEVVFDAVDAHRETLSHVVGLCVAGGIALNPILNTALAKRYRKPVHIPAAPGDNGLVLGMLYAARLQHDGDACRPEPVLYASYDLQDRDRLLDYVLECSGQHHMNRGSIPKLVRLLESGAVVAVLRGRQGIGTVMGHRSILARPTVDNRGKLQTLAGLGWYRSVGLLVPADAAPTYFFDPVHSPYQSFAMQVKPQYPRLLDAVHPGGLAFVQTVTRASELWLYDVLRALGHNGGLPLVLSVGIAANTIRQALHQLHTDPLLTHVFVDDFLFDKTVGCSAAA